MKKWFVIAIVAGGLYYFATHTDTGQIQWQRLSKAFRHWAPLSGTTSDGKTTVYKIENPDGSWTYSNQKPQDDSSAVQQHYHSDTNVVPALPERKLSDH